ncbi:MAG TPA: HAMP domain-containing sensor histidine kinase, partial [Solirubrobacter sp.]|nr:HAMP domain-containing sensor histidine kinase [Solirubrobacter sp.]
MAAAAAIVLAVALLVIAVPKLLSADLRGELDDALRRRAADVARLNATAPGELTSPGALEGGGLLVQVVDREGRIVARSSALGGRVLPVRSDVLRDRQPRLGDEEALRVYTAPLGELGRGEAAGGAVVVASDMSGIEHTLDRTRTLIALCALAAAALAAGVALLLTRRALRPLSRLSAGARAIGRSGDAAQRLPEPPAGDEVGELADTLNAMLASLERAQEAEHRFVGDASHELRTPLTALRGNAAYLARHGPDPDVIADIEAGAARLGELLDDLLALAREDAAAPARGEPVRLASLAEDVVVERDVWVLGERPALERAVDNLVRNAHKHGSGRVTVTVGGDEDGWAFVRVEDEGP